MTNAREVTSRHWHRTIAARRLVVCAVLCLVALPLAGCGTSGVTGDTADSMGPPTSLTAPATGRAKLAFAPIVGAPASVGEMLSTSVTAAVEKLNIPVSHSPADKPDYTVRGYLVASPDKSGTKVSYIWDVTDKTGQRAKRITGEEVVQGKKAKDPWTQIDKSVVDRIAASTAGQLGAWVSSGGGAAPAAAGAAPAAQNEPSSTQSSFGSTIGSLFGFGSTSDQTASAAPLPPPASAAPPAQTASLGGPKPGSLVTGKVVPPAASAPMTTGSLTPSGATTTAVPTVIGAPGDGATALTSAIQRSLSNNGVQLAAAGGTGSYTVQGKVTMGQPVAGKQTIKIEWMVFDPAGKKVGTVSQNNSVPQGSLDGTWGNTADAAAAAAAQGILKLLPHQSAG